MGKGMHEKGRAKSCFTFPCLHACRCPAFFTALRALGQATPGPVHQPSSPSDEVTELRAQLAAQAESLAALQALLDKREPATPATTAASKRPRRS